MMPLTPGAQIDELRRVIGESEQRRQAAEVKLADRERRLGTARQTIAAQDRRIGWLRPKSLGCETPPHRPCPMTTFATPRGSSTCTASAVPADARLPPQKPDDAATHKLAQSLSRHLRQEPMPPNIGPCTATTELDQKRRPEQDGCSTRSDDVWGHHMMTSPGLAVGG